MRTYYSKNKQKDDALSESAEQQILFQWASLQTNAIPELEMLYHIPNEGKRSLKTGARMKAEGLKAGMPDIHLPVARGGKHSLYVELKRHGGKLTTAQKKRMNALKEHGNEAMMCCGANEAIEVIMRYLSGKLV